MKPAGKFCNILMVTAATAMALLSSAARAVEVEITSREITRDVLALYDSRFEATPAATRIHRMAEMPLNWLGFKLTYRDVNAGLPDAEELKRYRGILTWLVEPLAQPRTYLDWLDAATAPGLRLVCFAELAPGEKNANPETAERIWNRLGLKDSDQFINVTFKSKPLTIDAAMIGFERPLDRLLPSFPVFETTSSAARVHLSLSVPDLEGQPSSALVVTGPGGGYAADAYAVYYEPASDRARWIINPFLFFKLALGNERFPVPDVTTLAGRRLYFSHIDGDGWNNISEIEGYRELQASAAEVIRREIIEPYPDLPVTVGLIAGDARPELGGSESARQSAAKIFALPQVEVASHTYTHPFTWSFFENYSRQAELALIEKEARPGTSLMDEVRGFLYRVAGKTEFSEARNRYVSGGGGLPRSYLKEPFDIEKEVRGALAVSESLAPPGKRAPILLWSGDTEPFEAAIKTSREAGVRNMNGGDSRLDADYPSVFYVPPIARPVGGERQIYAANSNENTYTNNWHGPYYGQILLKETLRNTEMPRRLKPFNLYYHMYSGEKPGALAALRAILDEARATPVIPVKASQYAAIADDFFAVEVAQADALSWTISKRGALQTFRFDEAQALDIDWGRSQGVLGTKRTNDALYIALDGAIEPAVIALRGTATPADERTFPPARLIGSRWQVRRFQVRDLCHFSIEAEGYGLGDMIWQTRPGQRFDIRAERAGTFITGSSFEADAAGQLSLKVAANAIEPLQIGFACHEP